jgi:hypothetical protein
MRHGDLASAGKDLESAIAFYRQAGMRPYLLRAMRSLAELRDRQGRPDEAAAARAEVERLIDELRVPEDAAPA